MTMEDRVDRMELVSKLQGLYRLWRGMTPEQQEAERQQCRGALVVAEIAIDQDDGTVCFQVIRR